MAADVNDLEHVPKHLRPASASPGNGKPLIPLYGRFAPVMLKNECHKMVHVAKLEHLGGLLHCEVSSWQQGSLTCSIVLQNVRDWCTLLSPNMCFIWKKYFCCTLLPKKLFFDDSAYKRLACSRLLNHFASIDSLLYNLNFRFPSSSPCAPRFIERFQPYSCHMSLIWKIIPLVVLLIAPTIAWAS